MIRQWFSDQSMATQGEVNFLYVICIVLLIIIFAVGMGVEANCKDEIDRKLRK